ncbi:hypothetical protein BSL78_17846 [Apostichopus japonicus]|uniref:Gustatory receptor n=1 Tax=Stichopus japonicus TaxID=307972 RepID=A0A2G8KBH4_STIJA|nr:hypothetical protein BSL78_17846 [Apostichopus japonicus]
MVMWSLGLIDWSSPKQDIFGDHPSFVAAVNGSKWKRRLLCVTSRLYLTLLLSVTALCGYKYLDKYFGESNHFFHFASYFITYLPLMAAPQLICFLTTICRWFHNNNNFSDDREDYWWNVLSEPSVSKRLYPFHLSKLQPPKLKYLLFFCSCGIINIIMETIHFCIYTKPPKTLKDDIYQSGEFVSTILNMWFFSLFCYFLFLQRLALESHFDHLLWFVRKHAGCLADCQTKLNECLSDFLGMRRLIRPWITFVICSTCFGLAVCVAWNYKVIGEEKAYVEMFTISEVNCSTTNFTTTAKSGFGYLNALIFTNKFTVLILSLLSVGGTDIVNIWKKYLFYVNILCSPNNERFWRKFSKLMRKLEVNTSGDTIIDMLLPVLLLAFGILGIDNFDF